MDWIDAVLGLLGVISLACFSFAIRQSLCAKQAAAAAWRDLAAFKTEVAKGYASTAALDKTEERIMGELKEINRTIGRLFEDIRASR